jgi:hypothetical protein
MARKTFEDLVAVAMSIQEVSVDENTYPIIPHRTADDFTGLKISYTTFINEEEVALSSQVDEDILVTLFSEPDLMLKVLKQEMELDISELTDGYFYKAYTGQMKEL